MTAIAINADTALTAFDALATDSTFLETKLKSFDQKGDTAQAALIKNVKSVLNVLCGKTPEGLTCLIDRILDTDIKLKLSPCCNVS